MERLEERAKSFDSRLLPLQAILENGRATGVILQPLQGNAVSGWSTFSLILKGLHPFSMRSRRIGSSIAGWHVVRVRQYSSESRFHKPSN